MQNNVYRSVDEMQGGHKYKKPDNKTRESISSIVHCNQRTDSNIKCQNVLVSIMLAVCVLSMLSGSTVTTPWRVLGLRIEDTASRYGG
jgi:hypothetical protein